MVKLLLTLFMVVAAASGTARADGCYVCGSGSSPQCRDFCRYSGADTFDSRRACERKGCKIGGTTSCPQDGKAQICLLPRPEGREVIASISWCGKVL